MKTARTRTPSTMTRGAPTRHRPTALLALGLLAVCAVPRPAQADEAAGDAGFPPPTVAPARTEKAPDADWSRPSTSPATASPASTPPIAAAPTTAQGSLPPPQIIRRSRRAPTRAAFPESVATAPVTRDVPATRALPAAARTSTSPTVPSRGTGLSTPLVSPTAADARRIRTRSTAPQGVRPACRILSIKKTHNVESDDIESSRLFLQLDVEYEVRGQQGRDVFVGIWFARSADGRLVRSLQRRYADAADNVTIQTRWTRVTGPAMQYAATLLIPYGTFPAHESGGSYEVDARVQLLRNEARGRVSLLARDKTTFRLYGLPADEQAATAPPSDGLDRVGIALAGETGEITEPGIRTGSGAKATPTSTGTIDDFTK